MNGKIPTTLELRDIHLPEPISWWPPAPGWWILLAAMALTIAGIFLFRFYLKKQALRKTVIAEFEAICTLYKENNNSLQFIQSLSILLRRTCISFYPRSEVAGLTGEAWLQFLNDTMGESARENEFITEHGQLLATAPYLSENTDLDIDADKLIQLCENWLRAQPNKKNGKTGQNYDAF